MRLYLSRPCHHVQPSALWGGHPWRHTLTRQPSLHHCSNGLMAASHRSLRRTHTWMHWLNFNHPKKLQVSRAVWRMVQRGVGLCVARHRTGLLLGAVCLTQKYDFDTNGITEASLERCRDENQVSSIKALLEATVTCPVCGKRQVLHDKVPGVDYCECREGNTVQWDRSYEGWMPFLEQHNILVWRKPHHRWPHLFAYKVYGRYDDVSLCAFAETQLSASYRTEWDPSALDLHMLGADKAVKEQQHADTYSAQDLLYWLVKFPSFFANRDYVFKRRYRCDGPRREVVIVSEAADEDSGIAEVAGVHRVHHYWSVMVVQARHRDFTKPGIEYVLSYFDNPGTSLPASITNFIASTAFPNFLQRLHDASLDLQRKHDAGEFVYKSLPRPILGAATTLEPAQQPQALLASEGATETTAVTPALEGSAIKEVMEALGEMTPSPEENVLLLKKIDQMLNDALDKLDDNNLLVAKLKYVRRKIDYYRIHNKMKKETGLIVEEFDERGNRYEDVRRPPVLVQQLFEAMWQVLKADHDMRTGRGLLNGDQSCAGACRGPEASAQTTKLQSCAPCSSTPAHSEESQASPRALEDDSESSDRSHDPESRSQISWPNWLYSVFIEKPISLIKSPSKSTEAASADKKAEEIKSEIPDGQKHEQDSGRDNDVPGGDQSTEQVPCQSESRLWYYAYGWLVWPTVKSESVVTEAPTATAVDPCTPCVEQSLGETDCVKQDHYWYWSPVVAIRRGGVWLYSYLTNSKL